MALGYLVDATGNGGGGGTGPTGSVIQGTYLELLALELSNAVVSGQVYEMTDYQTYGLTAMEQDLVSGVVEPMYLTGVDAGVFSLLAQSKSFPNDVIYYDVTTRQITTSAVMDIEGNAGLPPTIDNSSGATFDNLVGDTFTITYPYALDLSKNMEINLYNDFTGEQWARNDIASTLITAGDIVVNDLGGFQYEIQILFVSDAPFNQLFDFANQIGSNWFFKITTELPVASNKGTIFYRYNPDSNIEAKLGADSLGSIDTADFRAEIIRRYDMGSEGHVAPKNTDYSTTINGLWGSTIETYVVNPVDYVMLPTVDVGAKNIILVGGLSQKNITIMEEVDGFTSPDSDRDAHYQGACTGIVIEEGSVHSVIVLNGQRGTTVTNGSFVSDIVFKIEFVGLRIINSNIINWITPQYGPQKGWKLQNTTFTGGVDSLLFGDLAVSHNEVYISGGILNAVRFNFTISNGYHRYDLGKNIVSNTEFGSFVGDDNTIILKSAGGMNTNQFGVGGFGGGTCRVNHITMGGGSGVNNNIIRAFEGNTGNCLEFRNNTAPSSTISDNIFINGNFIDNIFVGGAGLNINTINREFAGNNISGSILNNVIDKGMIDCVINPGGQLNGNHFHQLVQDQTWNILWFNCGIICELVFARIYTVQQSRETIIRYDSANNDLYKIHIAAGVATYPIVS